ncbi:MAG: hypothetical protein JJE30_17635 [Desulfuromonadales bacterium]|nr:hypothetical protein [Desulfuromonadales bacterium]
MKSDRWSSNRVNRTNNRDSLDGLGMTMVGTVRYCPSSDDCPYDNAYWNGSQMVFGNGYAAADDVVGHELTHAVHPASACPPY